MNQLKHNILTWLLPLLLLVILVAGCEDRAGLITSPILTTPMVSATNPANASTGMPFNQKISATFTELMDSTTITTASFTLMQGTTFVSGTVSYTGTTATFAPSSNLTPNTLYIATITTMAKSHMEEGLANNYVWSFTTGAAAAITPPTVIMTDPLNAASSVPINQKIAASFSFAMDAPTITASTFTLMKGTSPVPGFVSYVGTTALFTPAAALASNTTYTATITTGAKDLAGNALASDYVWNFTTGAAIAVVPPVVNSTDPVNLAVSVPLSQKIAATFSKTLDASTMTTAVFTLKNTLTSAAVSGFVSYSGTTAIFAPAANLSATTSYTATITTGAKDLAGNALAANYVWTFTTSAAPVVTLPTVISTDPLDLATGVALNQKITATFSKSMDASTITASTFILMLGAAAVPGFVSYSGTIATLIPASSLASNAVYTATITTGAKDLTGASLVSNYVWTFTTSLGGGGLRVALGTSARYAVLSNSTITNIPTSALTGDVGISPGARSSIAGLTLPEVSGTIFAADDASPVPAMLIAAKTDALNAYLDATAAVRGTPTPLSGNINGLTLVPGLYASGTSIELSPGGIVYLDGQGDVNAVFVIRSATSITTSATSQVVLTNGANARNIFWSAGSAVTLGTNSKMKGTIIASTSISLLTGARLDGRALIQGAAAGQVSLDQNIIVLP